MKITTFIDEISPKNTSQISISWNEIRETIYKNSDIISDSFLTGSYIRHTKIHPIDDLDIFFEINLLPWLELEECENNKFKILSIVNNYPYESGSDNKKYLSPIKIINHIWNIVKTRYPNTREQWRNWECYTAFFSSYNLTIDCVPCVRLVSGDYLIPYWWNNLYWKKTNPKIDEEKIDELNKYYDKRLKGIIKIMKFWNKKYNNSRFKSYHLECLIYYCFQEKGNISMSYIELIWKILEYIYSNIKNYWNITDLPRFNYMYFYFADNQKKAILDLLSVFYGTLQYWEEYIVSYLKK